MLLMGTSFLGFWYWLLISFSEHYYSCCFCLCIFFVVVQFYDIKIVHFRVVTKLHSGTYSNNNKTALIIHRIKCNAPTQRAFSKVAIVFGNFFFFLLQVFGHYCFCCYDNHSETIYRKIEIKLMCAKGLCLKR